MALYCDLPVFKDVFQLIAMQKEGVRIAEEKSQRDDVYRENQAKRNVELYKIRVKAYRDVAVEYAHNQPKTVTNNNIYWK